MPKKAITELVVSRTRPPAKGRVEIWDTHLSGFVFRITDKGIRSFGVMTRVGDTRIRVTLGRYPAMSLSDAREAAKEAINKAARGVDPRNKPDVTQEAPKTFSGVVDDFMDKYVKVKNRRPEYTQWVFDKYAKPTWGSRRIDTITRREVIELIEGIAEGGAPVMANRVLGRLRKLFAWHVARGDGTDPNPCVNIDPPGAETTRDRVLEVSELKLMWAASEDLGHPYGAFAKMLLLTAQRRAEVAGMRWADIDLDGGLWTLPRESSKSDRAHEVPLSPLAVETLANLPRIMIGHEDGSLRPSEFVLTIGGKKPINSYSDAKEGIDEKMLSRAVMEAEEAGAEAPETLKPWRFHDLRRTAATGMARLGIAPHVVEKVLNHSSGAISGVAAIYNRYAYTGEKRHALETWSSYVDGLVKGRPSNVVPLVTEQ